MDNKWFGIVSWWLVIVGGINWGLVGIADINIVSAIFGGSFLARLIYILVGVGAGYLIYEKFFMKKVI